jgi:ribosomal protein S18 acetylase RimI-like enzyme
LDSARTYLQDLWNTPRAAGVVAESKGNVVGFVLGHTEQHDRGLHFYLSEMCVLSGLQGQGVGKKLIEALEADLRAQGVRKLYLLTARDGAAEAFYHACGFYTSEKMVMLGRYL